MRVGVSAALLLGLLRSAFGQVADGFIGGTARDSASGKPRRRFASLLTTWLSGPIAWPSPMPTGSRSSRDLEPGRYDVAATKTGFETASTTIDVEGKHLVRVDLPLTGDANAAATTTEPDNQPATDREKKLQDEIDRLEARLAAMEIKDAAQPSAEAKADGTSTSMTASLNPADVPSPDAAPAPQVGTATASASATAAASASTAAAPAAAADPPPALPQGLQPPPALSGTGQRYPVRIRRF